MAEGWRDVRQELSSAPGQQRSQMSAGSSFYRSGTGSGWRPMTSRPTSSRQLVERSKFGNNDMFAVWKGGGRAITPHSFWKEERKYDAVVPPSARGRRRDYSPLGSEKGEEETCFRPAVPAAVRTVLAVGTSEATRAGMLDGVWFSQQDGELRARIEGHLLHWACDDTTAKLKLSEESLTVCLKVDGQLFLASLSEDGRRLVWGDGDVWAREEQDWKDFVEVRVMSARGPRQQPVPDSSIGWSNWKVHWRKNSDGPAWPRPTTSVSRFSAQASGVLDPGTSFEGHSAGAMTLPPLRGILVMDGDG
eukprot:CAMPEP_0197625466 /NCGR_PEP_ID=MMETSP1338-20131121/4826_1 /TAXON_ID=43686 ORGANISM="Pelagodinium beii, Strain RCC1491" /NCGR_SAMPLE_ID=MMETSP1338 /ASSEMBLY_ACC=CAM_ASM_000754 /LENGTH=304 /DNA_ID=CAMNT_0043195885 /DNA_START=46 /DNA_END=958 /DNA_ORIENTATION=+